MSNTILAGNQAYIGNQGTTVYAHESKDVRTTGALNLSTEADVSGAGFTVKKYDTAAWEKYFGGASRAAKAYGARAGAAVQYQNSVSGWDAVAAGRRMASGADLAKLV